MKVREMDVGTQVSGLVSNAAVVVFMIFSKLMRKQSNTHLTS